MTNKEALESVLKAAAVMTQMGKYEEAKGALSSASLILQQIINHPATAQLLWEPEECR